MNEKILDRAKGGGQASSGDTSKPGSSQPQAGRPQKENDQKSEKTIKNLESQG
jgi:hypothetical protein